MPFLSKLAIIAIKTETTQDTAATIVAADFTYAKDLAIDPVAEFLPREYLRSSLDQLAAVLGQFYVKVSFKLPVRGSGTRGTALAPMGAVFLAAGHSETVVAVTSVTYAPVSAPASSSFYTMGKSATVEMYLGSTVGAVKHQVKGCVCSSLKVSHPAGKIAYLDVEMVGLYVAKTNTDMPTQTYVTTVEPVWQSSALSMFAVSPISPLFEIDWGLEYDIREDSASPYGIKGFMVTGRNPKGRVTIEEVPIATKDYLATMIANTEGSSSFVNGSAQGNITTITCPKTQIVGLKYNRGGKRLLLDLDVQFDQNSGDDWISYVQT